MFDIGWSEFVVIAVVALIAIGPKELPGVLRMVGQWMGKARRMAAEFQGQFQEAMREAEMADLKKSFDEVKEAATGFTSGNVMTSLEKDVSNALRIDDIDKPANSSTETPVTSSPETPANSEVRGIEPPVMPTTPATPNIEAQDAAVPETFAEVDAHALKPEPPAKPEPLAITPENHAQPAPQDTAAAAPDLLKDAKAS